MVAKFSQAAIHFLDAKSTEERLRILQQMTDDSRRLPLSLTEDLFCLNLQPRLQGALLKATTAPTRLELEDFLTANLRQWDQNVAAIALWEWALRTDCVLWHRVLPLAHDPRIAQRVGYTLLDLAWYSAGDELVRTFANLEGLEGLSPAFQAILLYRAVQWDTPSDRLQGIAHKMLDELHQNPFPGEKTVPYAIAYLLRFDPKGVQKSPFFANIQGIWPDLARWFTRASQNDAQIGELEHQLKKKKAPTLSFWMDHWPHLWDRHKIPADLLRECLNAFIQAPKTGDLADAAKAWELFAGIPTPVMVQCLLGMDSETTLAAALGLVGNLLNTRTPLGLLDNIKNRLTASSDPAAFVAALPQRFRIQLNQDAKPGSVFYRVFEEQRFVLQTTQMDTSFTSLYEKQSSVTGEDGERRTFMNLAYRDPSATPKQANPATYWGALTNAWIHPEPKQIPALAQLARQASPLFQICYLHTLGRFRHNDEAALKLLDFIRTSDEDILAAVVRALAGIGTQRALQELISFLTRPNITTNTQMEIIQILQQADLSQLQKELRSAISDLQAAPSAESPAWDVKESLAGLLSIDPENQTVVPPSAPSGDHASPSTETLDQMLQNKIPNYVRLSSEIKRALRTAQFFHLKVQGARDLHTIDLSPAIDMQYKALELLFRENFEASCSDVISQGVIGRKLDVIGYARPIPPAMDEFERYIETLDVVKTIPFFSKFKLRKMLRAICQFRPGKRFTLDGLKAFALFFLCFSRKDCRYGLANLFPLPTMNDRQLAEFCKMLHLFQDFRNRAAHEGFHPDASNDLDKIWRDTAEIIQHAVAIKQSLDELQANTVAGAAPSSKSQPTVVHKRVS